MQLRDEWNSLQQNIHPCIFLHDIWREGGVERCLTSRHLYNLVACGSICTISGIREIV